jgi:hypothetical protein
MCIIITISISVRLARAVYKAMWQVTPYCAAASGSQFSFIGAAFR